MNTGARTPGFSLQLCRQQQPWASLLSPCLSFPKLFTRQELGNRQVWLQEEP